MLSLSSFEKIYRVEQSHFVNVQKQPREEEGKTLDKYLDSRNVVDRIFYDKVYFNSTHVRVKFSFQKFYPPLPSPKKIYKLYINRQQIPYLN